MAHSLPMLFPTQLNGHQLKPLFVLLVFAKLLQTDLAENQEEIKEKKLHKDHGLVTSNHNQDLLNNKVSKNKVEDNKEDTVADKVEISQELEVELTGDADIKLVNEDFYVIFFYCFYKA